MNGATIVIALCIAIIQIILIFAVIRISENVKEMNNTLDELNSKLYYISSAITYIGNNVNATGTNNPSANNIPNYEQQQSTN